MLEASSLLLSIPVWTQYVHAIEWGLRFFADYTGSAGLAVIVFTILIKMVLLPLTIKSVRSTYSMQEIQPKIKELQKKFGKDRQRLSAEQMKLYQEHGINPASGCVPMLIQIPIFWGLYIAIEHLARAHVGVWGTGFLWINSLAKPDPLHILPLLAGFFQLIQTRMTRPAGMGKPDDPQQQMMTTMMTFMPLMVVVFGWAFASGPVIYWVTQSAFSVVQQWFISGWGSMLDWAPWLPDLPEHRRLGYEHPEKRAARIAKAAENGGSGGLFAMLQRQVENQQNKVISQSVVEEEPGDGGRAARGETGGSRARAGQRRGTAARSGLNGHGGATGRPNGAAGADGQASSNPNLVPRRSRSKRRGERK
ncbi:MAG TPA: YidC/Oxa1 family membrane protein insertase [Thermomicrobiaceae bacterium]|nr:YidC/Oxa1 family membrane protein insertase [Thermomicrobiaceae bacterium]